MIVLSLINGNRFMQQKSKQRDLLGPFFLCKNILKKLEYFCRQAHMHHDTFSTHERHKEVIT
jgi:hypothetical protein